MKFVKIPVLVVLMLCVVGSCIAAKKYTDKSSLCRIKIGDTFTSVIRQYGKTYKFTTLREMENIHALIYNDPKTDAQLIITCGVYPFRGIAKAKVDGIHLKQGRYRGKRHFANKTFAKTGTAEDITLGATKRQIRKKYPSVVFFTEDNKELGNIFLGIANDLAVSYEFTFSKGAAVKISLVCSQ